ncbi:phosphorylase [Accumulibacter sp.]|uniref:ATP adenylyltransferase family protein n=1 Tax=Accumulibacter sp. TaxID=2053492 RepID=UPI0025F14A33|nr:phosphorylase [Accumulibacter sp.]MCM8596489.1 phosphorylase [Accumulibacter sp.]MCM8627339.1 phosphorylase [Accumulibacter sp.]MDS4050637.1 phosphorylase [Accumulibacter sp.]
MVLEDESSPDRLIARVASGDSCDGRTIMLDPGRLAGLVAQRTRSAIDEGALQRIETGEEIVEDRGVRFVVRTASSLRRKSVAARLPTAGETPRNPFLPPEPALTVAEVSPGHIAVLNKFNVLDGHLLLVTSAFEDQRTLLGPADFAAWCACLAEYPGLGFYNGGPEAGASQSHKHLQIVPLPLSMAEPGVPIAALFGGEGPACPAIPFAHGFARLRSARAGDLVSVGSEAHALYRRLLADLGIGAIRRDGREWQSAPYNLLLTRDWMLVVPRRCESWQGISINGLGFAGSLFVRHTGELERIRRHGPMGVLQTVSGR